MNRFLVWLLALIVLMSCCGTPQETATPIPASSIKNVLLITIDTLRPDALSIYGNRTRSPFFERIARDSVVFDRAFTVAPLTLPAHTSILTGLYPPSHGVRNNGTFRASPALTLLPEIARKHGLETAAVIGGFPLAARFGLNQGFQMYDDSFSSAPASGTFTYAEKNAESVRLSAQSWLQQNGARPFFLWMHFFDPHHPYLKHGSSNLEPYLQEVLFVDQQLGTFFDFLKANNLLDDTVVVIAGDHGEAFGEHGEVSHSIFIYNTTLRVPFLLLVPGHKAQRRQEVVRVIDIFPTILDIMKWKPENPVDGISLVPLLEGKTIPDLDAYSETLAPALDFGWSPLFSIQNSTQKFIEAPREEFYNLAQDAAEMNNLIASADSAKFKKKIEAIQSHKPPETSPPVLAAEDLEKLRSLGYVASGARVSRKSNVDPKDRIELAHQIAELTSSNLPVSEKAQAYKKLITVDPENPLLLLRYGEVLSAAKRLKEASAVFQTVIRLDYPSAAAYNGLAAVYFAEGNLKLAEDTLLLAARKSLGDGETYYNLAEIALNRGQFNQALVNYGQSMNFQFSPAFHRIYAVALGYRQQGDLEKSREAARLFLQNAPAEMKEQRALMQKLL
jgi:choline-sulfatase